MFKWMLFRDAGPWHYAFHQAEHPPHKPRKRGWKNWRARCGVEFTPAALKVQDEKPEDAPEPVCQRCSRKLEA
jgi:hypothetical protein